jgi:hypothetical protein
VQVWEVKSNDVDIAVTPSSNKAFIHWHVRGVQKDTQQVRRWAGLAFTGWLRRQGKHSHATDHGYGMPAMRPAGCLYTLLILSQPGLCLLAAAGERHVRA